jgi:hypothetical protein
MDLLSIARKIWRYKLATAPVIALTIVGMAYVVAIKSPVYEAGSSYILINPPAPPSELQIERNPELGKINPDNPYTRFSDPSVVIDILSRTMTSAPSRQELVRAGASPDYTVTSAAHFGMTSPIVQITAMAPTPEAAVRTATVVGHAVVSELDRMQKEEDVDRLYRIKAMPVDVAESAELRASGQLRLLVGIVALGAILLFVVVSVFDALAKLRAEPRARAAAADHGWTHEGWHRAGVLSDLDGKANPASDEDELKGLSSDFRPEPAPSSTAETNGHAYGTIQSRGEEHRSSS